LKVGDLKEPLDYPGLEEHSHQRAGAFSFTGDRVPRMRVGGRRAHDAIARRAKMRGVMNFARVIAYGYPRCSGAGHLEEDSRIGPLLEARETRHDQGYSSKEFPDPDYREQIHRVTEMGQNIGRRRAGHEHGSPMH